jgi:hypothetical protein
MKQPQADMLNNVLRDELYMSAQQGQYLNDGGQLDPDFIDAMSEEEWQQLTEKFFPYQAKINQ